MKFLLFSSVTGDSGSAVRFSNIANNFSRQGFTIVYTERKADHSISHLNSAITAYYTPKLPNLYIDIVISTLFNIWILLKNLDCCLLYALKPSPNTCIPALLGKIFGKKIILDIDDLDYGYLPRGLPRTISYWMFHFFPHFFGLVTCHTENLFRYINQNIGIRSKKVYFLTQGVSDTFLEYAHNTMQQKKKKSIIYAATLGITSDLEKIIIMLKNICINHPDCCITIIGDGCRKAEFETICKNSGIEKNVCFTGKVDHDKIPSLISRHSIGINYMIKSFTNDCRAILKLREYLACGLQVVCNDVGDVSLFKDHIYIETSIEAMEKRIDALFHATIQDNAKGRQYILDTFCWNNIIEKFVEDLFDKKLIAHS